MTVVATSDTPRCRPPNRSELADRFSPNSLQYAHYGFPGSEHYITALRHLLQDQLLFGSVYPNCGPLVELRQIVSSWALPPTVERKYLRDNASRLLGL